MEITGEQYEIIKDSLPIQRGNVKLQNLEVLNAILFVAEQGCKWRGLPPRFGPPFFYAFCRPGTQSLYHRKQRGFFDFEGLMQTPSPLNWRI